MLHTCYTLVTHLFIVMSAECEPDVERDSLSPQNTKDLFTIRQIIQLYFDNLGTDVLAKCKPWRNATGKHGQF